MLAQGFTFSSNSDLTAGLLTFGSIYLPHLPIRHLRLLSDLGGEQWLSRLSYPITAAGPYRNDTGFPIKPQSETP